MHHKWLVAKKQMWCGIEPKMFAHWLAMWSDHIPSTGPPTLCLRFLMDLTFHRKNAMVVI